MSQEKMQCAMDSRATTRALPTTASEIARKAIDRHPLTILDVRNEEAYTDWRIEAAEIRSVNLPYYEMLEGIDAALPYLPNNDPIVVVCAKEGSSRFVAEQLIEAGRTRVYFLAGGMKAWSEHLEPVKIGDLTGGGELYQFVRIGKGCLSYMILSGGEAAVIDAVRMTDIFKQFAEAKGVQIKHVVDTHLHADHVSGGRKLAVDTGARYWLPPEDADEVVYAYDPLEDGQVLSIGDTEIAIRPLYSPGHTIGSTSLIVDHRYLLSGDLLFVKSIGRPDLAGKAGDWADDLRTTLYSRFKSLPETLTVLPAHFGNPGEMREDGSISAKLGELFEHNPGLNIRDAESFRQAVTMNLPQQPNSYEAIRRTNMGLIEPSQDELQEMETGPNRCAIHE
ncbi:MBL fold metallo-hydrolase [Cohnella boryungensis]|uniref:MBL fold metallo-hydrolase n=1 Tax=Cohnella boryungensis TaxID=768479 RepID=A0ABV8SF98_9BACL